MKTLMFIIDLPFRFLFAFLGFTFGGWIGWVGLILIALKLFHVIGWLPWWAAALPLAYGVLYCLYMTIDGALYRLGWKDVGGYARLTQEPLVAEHAQSEQSKIEEIIGEGPERIGATIDASCDDLNRRRFAQALLDAALEPYFLLQLAMFANKKVNAYVTIKKWKDAGLKLPPEGTPGFFPTMTTLKRLHRRSNRSNKEVNRAKCLKRSATAKLALNPTNSADCSRFRHRFTLG